MISGILFTIAACFFWGLVFVIPSFLRGFHPLEIALGRFFIYGLFSFLILLLTKRELFSKKHASYWKKAAYLSLFSSVLCYTATVCNMQYAGPTIATLVFAMSPICISLVGNWHKKEYPFQKLYLPLALMVIGIFLAKFKGFESDPESSLWLSLLGIFFGLVGLASWTWFAVANSHFLKQNKELSVNNWALMLGTCTLVQVLLVGTILFAFLGTKEKYFIFSPELQNFILFSFILGTVSTLLSLFLWNHGSKRIPISLAGQLMIFEIIFALILIYFVEQKLPTLMELGGIVFMISGVLIGFKKLKSPVQA